MADTQNKTERFELLMAPSLRNRLEREAERKDVSEASIVRKALRAYLKQQKGA